MILVLITNLMLGLVYPISEFVRKQRIVLSPLIFVDTGPLVEGLLMEETNDNNVINAKEPTLVVSSLFTLMN